MDQSTHKKKKYSTYDRSVHSIDDRLIVVQIVLSTDVYGYSQRCGIWSEFQQRFELNCFHNEFHIVKILKKNCQ